MKEREDGTEEERNEIWASIGITKNIGNYESVRVDAGIRLPVGNKSIEEVYKQAWKLVDKEIDNKIIELDNALGKTK